jgi:hypothetical protein
MIKLVVKLALAALVANAVFRVGSEYLTFFRFRDAVHGAAVYKATSDDDLRRRIAVLATEYDIPIDAEEVNVERHGRVITVKTAYHKPIDLLPRYSFEWPFTVSLEAETSSAPPLPGGPPPR